MSDAQGSPQHVEGDLSAVTRQRLVSGRRVRDWIFVPAILQFAFALQLVYGPGSQVGFLRYLVGAGTFAVGRTIILPFTWAFSLALAAYGVYLFGVRYREDPLRTVVYAVSLPFGATFLFETTYNALGNAHFNGNWLNWYGTPWVMGLALASAAAIVLATLRYWRITRGLGVALAAWVGFGWLGTSSGTLKSTTPRDPCGMSLSGSTSPRSSCPTW